MFGRAEFCITASCIFHREGGYLGAVVFSHPLDEAPDLFTVVADYFDDNCVRGDLVGRRRKATAPISFNIIMYKQ